MNQQLEQVRAKVIEAVPEIGLNVRTGLALRPTRLSDVLVAVMEFGKEGHDYAVSIDGYLCEMNELTGTSTKMWNLRADSLDEQSPETIAFLHKILV